MKYKIDMGERREFPWEREWEFELDGMGMGWNGNRTVPVKT
jgi:hypothetical protein